MVSKKFKVTAETGIHARPATILVNQAVKFNSNISLKVNNKMVDLKSIMGVMSLGIYSGEFFTISCLGEDEEQALQALTNSVYELKIGKEE